MSKAFEFYPKDGKVIAARLREDAALLASVKLLPRSAPKDAVGARYNQQTFRRRGHCGTAACAMGWIGILSPRKTGYIKLNRRNMPEIIGDCANGIGGCSAVVARYGISPKEALHLFGMQNPVAVEGPAARNSVVRRMRALADKYEKGAA